MAPKEIDFGGGLNWLDPTPEDGSLTKILSDFSKLILNDVYNLGGNNDDIRKVIANPMLRRKLTELIRTPAYALFPDFNLDKNHYGVKADVPPSNFKMRDLMLVSFLENDEEAIDGDLLLERAKKLRANLGIYDAKYILDYKNAISEEFNGKYLMFTGTQLYFGGKLRILGMAAEDGVWKSSLYSVYENKWNSRSCLLGIKK